MGKGFSQVATSYKSMPLSSPLVVLSRQHCDRPSVPRPWCVDRWHCCSGEGQCGECSVCYSRPLPRSRGQHPFLLCNHPHGRAGRFSPSIQPNAWPPVQLLPLLSIPNSLSPRYAFPLVFLIPYLGAWEGKRARETWETVLSLTDSFCV